MIKSFVRAASVSVVFSFCLAAQSSDAPPQAQTPADNGSIPATLIQPVERAANYLNFYTFFNGLFDDASSGSGSGGVNGAAFDVGAGVSANHEWATGTLQFSYHADYRTSADPQYTGGTDQTVSGIYRKLITRRQTFSTQFSGGIYPEGTAILQPNVGTETNVIQNTPYALKTYFGGLSLAYSYQQTQRLSYEATGTFYLMRFNGPVGFGSNDYGASGSVLYRVSKKTTLSTTLQDNYFHYQRNVGNANSETFYLTVSHNFGNHWTGGVSGGISRLNDSGTYTLPAELEVGQTLVPVLVQGAYKINSTLPYYQGTIARSFRHMLMSLNGGESVTPGNGVFLASKTIGGGGVFSYTMPRSNISAGGYVSDLSSASATAAQKITTVDLSAGYSYNLIRHLGLNAHYDHINYGTFGSYNGYTDNRFSFGVYFSSRDVPLALF